MSGNRELSTLPSIAAVGANSPVIASCFCRRSASFSTPGGSNLVAPCESLVCASIGCHCTVLLRVCPLGKVTVNFGA